MALTYTWEVTAMKVVQTPECPNYVCQTYWKKTGTDENGISGTFAGATPFAVDPSQESYTPYDQLTQEIVLSWIQPIVVDTYAERVDAEIAKQIADKIDPITEPPLPWADSSDSSGVTA